MNSWEVLQFLQNIKNFNKDTLEERLSSIHALKKDNEFNIVRTLYKSEEWLGLSSRCKFSYDRLNNSGTVKIPDLFSWDRRSLFIDGNIQRGESLSNQIPWKNKK